MSSVHPGKNGLFIAEARPVAAPLPRTEMNVSTEGRWCPPHGCASCPPLGCGVVTVPTGS